METVVYAGFNRDGEFRQFVRVNASNLHVHPAFVRQTLIHDIGKYPTTYFSTGIVQNVFFFVKIQV